MDRGRSLFIFKVKGQISRSARTIQPRLLKLSVYTKYKKKKKPIDFQGQRSNVKVSGPLQRILALGSLWAGYSKNYLA